MFRIGDFSRVARVSARLLRFYDEIGLLRPVHADARTGYRFYSVEQLARLNRITVLKELGFSLEQIGEMLASQIAPAELRSMLMVRRSDAEQTLALEAQRLRQIELRIGQIESEGRLTFEDVVVRAEPARRLLSLRRVVPSFAAARELIGLLRAEVRSLPAGLRSGQLVAVAHSQDFEVDQIDVEFGVTLEGVDSPALAPGSPLSVRELPAVARMAVCVRVGLPEDAHQVTAKIGQFVEAGGETFAGPSREVFLQPPRLDRMQETVVEMQFPLRPASAFDGVAEP